MKFLFFSFAFLSLAFLGCKPQTKPELNEEAPFLVNVKECYQFIAKKDTITLSYQTKNQLVSGNLHFDNFEKDSSHGSIEGTFSGDTLKLTYTFQSEGTTSKREIFFLKDGISLLMSIGEMEEKNGTSVYKKDMPMPFSKELALVKADCDRLHSPE